MGNIFNMFGPSPIRPIEKHIHKAHCTAKLLAPFFEAVACNDWQTATELHNDITQCEKEADEIKKDLRQHLPTGLFLPVPRTDLLELLNAQDRISNKAKDIAGIVIGRHMQLPASLQPLFMPFLDECISASKQACKAVNELDELLETGFRGNEVRVVEDMLDELDNIEHHTDEKLVEIRRHIFQLEKKLPAIEIMFLYKIVEWTADLADHAQTAGGKLQLLIAR